MRIAITADPDIPVPPKEYGGIERIIDVLIRGLIKKGHEVTLFASGDSTISCPLVPWTRRNVALWDIAVNSCRAAAHIRGGGFDLIHSFGRLGYLSLLLPAPIPKIMSYQRPITRKSIIRGKRLSFGSIHFSACSRSMTSQVADLSPWHVIYNSVAPEQYEFQPFAAPDAPLVFLGRMEHIKGTHLAVETARRTDRRLIIAGNIPPGATHRAYFNERILPHIDGERIRYIGPVGDAEKNRLLGGAAALLMPILWDEPFGIVMAEALACGTPVIALNRGSVPEVVEHGTNGFVCENADEMVLAIGRLAEIRREACRRTMEERFSGPVMVDQYIRLYRSLLNGERACA